MKRNGYRRLVLSYIPILLFVVSVLFLVFYGTIYELTRKQAVKANEMFAQHALQNLNYSLRMIDQLMIKEILTNEQFNKFFDPAHQNDSYLSYKVTEKLKELVGTVPSVHSIYLYRTYDQKVLSENIFLPADLYGDKEFIRNYMSGGISSYQWTDPRSFYEFDNDPGRSVVTLVKRVPLLSGSDGIVVINVSTDTLAKLFTEMTQSEISLLYLTDSSDQWIRGYLSQSESAGATPWKDLWGSSIVVSELSGWKIHAGIKKEGLYSIIIKTSSNFWILVGLIGVLIGVAWLFRASRNHYQPLAAMLSRVQQMPQKLDWNGKEDEFRYIGMAFDRLVEHSSTLEKQAKESSIYRRKVLFTEIMEGLRILSDKEWQQEAASIGWPSTHGWLTVALIEIDKYKKFQEIYSAKDQYLLKFVLQDVLKEMAQEQGIPIWAEWLSNTELGVLIALDDCREEPLLNWLEKLREWVVANLDFTVTIALGGMIHDISDLSLSRDEASQAMRYKTTLGMNRIIVFADLQHRTDHGIYEKHQMFKQLAEQYRLRDDSWQVQMKAIATSLEDELFERDELVDMVHYLLYQFGREMQQLSTEYRTIWQQEAQSEIITLLDHFETSVELFGRLEDILIHASQKMESTRDERNVFNTVQQVMSYLQQNYADPSLSLIQLSDQFGMASAQLSRLFKEEVGEKLVDYLAKLRMEQAKHLLLETSKPVQEIALDVGYVHSFSFIRVFKKLVGQTPGEFRKG